jgi:acyl-CoA hydrolase
MIVKTCIIHHVVMGADLNHHGTLFAGQGAKWFVEAGFISAANLTSPENVVCANIHGMQFKKPAPLGTIIRYESKIVLTGNSRMVAYIRAIQSKSNELFVDGFITFVHVDLNGRPIPHGIKIECEKPEDIELQQKAMSL